MRIILLFLLLFPLPAAGGFERTEAGARQAAMSNAVVGLSGDLWTMFFNPGGLARLSGPEAGFSISPSPFGLRELTLMTAAAAVPTSVGVWGAAFRTTGFELYREVSASISLARSFPLFDVGLTLRYCGVSIMNYGRAGCLGVDAGILLHPASNLQCALGALNLNAPSIGNDEEKLSQSFLLGAGWSASQDLTVLVELEKVLGFVPAWRLGIEYHPAEIIAIRTGLGERPTPLAAGFGLHLGFVAFDYAYSVHEELGGTHELTISIK